jgi:hypothetical protein
VETRYGPAQDQVDSIRAAFPGASPEQLADHLIRKYAKELAVGGAMSGGAAASPVGGLTFVAAAAGADAAFSAGRLGEMVMAIGLVLGHDDSTAEQRTVWMRAVLGMADGAAVGLTGLAARVGTRGGAKLLSRLPTSAVSAAEQRASQKMLSRMVRPGGKWGVASLIPYGIGAGVGAAGNVALAFGVGRAAKEFFARTPPVARNGKVAEVVDDETELLEDEPGFTAPGRRPQAADDIIDAEIVDADIVDAEIVE